MAFLPDTNLWISLLKNPGGKLDAKVRSQPVPDILLCAVVKAELWHGAEKYGNRERRRLALDMLFAPFASPQARCDCASGEEGSRQRAKPTAPM